MKTLTFLQMRAPIARTLARGVVGFDVIRSLHVSMNSQAIGIAHALEGGVPCDALLDSWDHAIFVPRGEDALHGPCGHLAQDFVSEGLTYGLPQAGLLPAILFTMNVVVRDMDGFKHIPVSKDPLTYIMQYTCDDTCWRAMWQELKKR